MTKRAIICGGSIGGLLAAVALQSAGWTVDVFERSEQGLSGRGAGIVTHKELLDILQTLGADTSDIGVQVTQRIALNQSGQPIATLLYPQAVTSWDRIHTILRRLIPDAHYYLGRQCTGFRHGVGHATALFSDGSEEAADLVIGADGFRSAIRAQLLPNVRPTYAGYVVWRALAQQSDMATAADIFPHFSIFAPAGSQALGYPIAGTNNDLRDGHLRYNLVWYVPVAAPDLRHMLTDTTGTEHAISIPPPLINDNVIDGFMARAKSDLPKVFADVFTQGDRPFFTPIYDLHSPLMANGRVALVGDAACTARPHVGMGVTKAAADALALAQCLTNTDIDAGLKAYSQTRVAASAAAHGQAQMLGSWITEADPKNKDGADNKRLSQIMELTASCVS